MWFENWKGGWSGFGWIRWSWLSWIGFNGGGCGRFLATKPMKYEEVFFYCKNEVLGVFVLYQQTNPLFLDFLSLEKWSKVFSQLLSVSLPLSSLENAAPMRARSWSANVGWARLWYTALDGQFALCKESSWQACDSNYGVNGRDRGNSRAVFFFFAEMWRWERGWFEGASGFRIWFWGLGSALRWSRRCGRFMPPNFMQRLGLHFSYNKKVYKIY